MFYKKNKKNYKNIFEGIDLKALTYGKKTLLSEFKIKKGAVLPNHSHPHEQTGYLVSGKMTLIINGEEFNAEPGDSWCIHGDIEHGAKVHEDSIAIEVFSPVREEYLP